MSRIDDALRRAAGQLPATSGAPAEAASPPAERADVGVLAQEPFPIELAERRRVRDQPSGTDHPSRELPPAGPAADPPKTAGPRASLFDRIDTTLAEKVVADTKMDPASREQYRRLAAVLHDAQETTGLRIVMIASAAAGEGKTLTATNLALTLSESYHKKVLLIDADLRKPALHKVFQLETASGLIDGLDAETNAKLVLRQVTPRLSVLPAGRPTSDPMAGLTSERMRHLLREAKETFDWVFLDTPPLMLLPDAHLLSLMVDGTVLVVRANATAHEAVKRAADVVGRNRIAGVVLNQADRRAQPDYNGQYSYYYQDSHDQQRRDSKEGA
jgi:protein-tyrosine kinase